MQPVRIIIVVVIAVLAVAAIVFFLRLPGRQAGPQTNSFDNENITIAATIFPLADIARSVAGQHANVIQLLPSGADPHSYSLTPRQVADLQNAKALFVIGHNLDDWAADSVARSTNLPVIVVDQNITLREFGEEEEHKDEADKHEEDDHDHDSGTDPHYWLTIPNAQIIAQTISDELSRIDPENTTHYKLQTTNYLAELDALESELQTIARPAPQKDFIAVHDAWSYLASHYGFHLAATYEPVEGREPSIADLQELQSVVNEHGITAFYDEPAKHTTSATQFIQKDLGLTIKVLDDIGGVPPRDSYQNLMRFNIESLAGVQ